MSPIPRSARKKSNSGVYHVIFRGANRQEIFHDDQDCRRFLTTLQKYKIQTDMKIYAWCLMGNHVHLLVKEENESISLVMKRLGISYAMYYNWKYRTTGHLFEDRFKSENVEDNRYLLTAARYIHQNPVKAGIASHPAEWKWSSCLGYYKKFVYPPNLLDSHFLLNIFSSNESIARTRFKEFNERINDDQCLEGYEDSRKRMTDDEARAEIRKCMESLEIPHVKSLPREQRNEVLRKIKAINGLSHRQAARILGISPNLISKA
ncbi:transposase [Metabacillus sp. GX 13764]|uniref:REP-associated tyrosine transposase n=1 Tax=Metabacillus kandeliae TaxID=2900151 RepID=UPI001E2BE85D|nr:transposase [Metabacillus kandeliae]